MNDLALSLLIWTGVVALVGAIQLWRGQEGAGLIVAYLVALSIIHWPGALVHALPWYLYRDPDLNGLGFRQALIGALSFSAGALIVAPLLTGRRPLAALAPLRPAAIPALYTGVGLLSLLVIFPLLSRVSSLAAVLANLNQLFLIGGALGCIYSWEAGRRLAFLGWFGLAISQPLLTVLLQGFLGYGVQSMFVLLLLFFSLARSAGRWLLLIPLVAFLGLSVYVTYMRDRVELRTTIWGGETIEARLGELGATVGRFEWFDLRNQAHLRRVDERLNQNVLVGLAAFNLSNGLRAYADGETFWEALLAPVPRALWPEKPVVAGSPAVVAAYTGLEFAAGTSVGVGQILEFYINFGTDGVVVGCLLLGVTLGVIDRLAYRALARGDWRRFTLLYLPGLGFLQPGGSLVEVVGTVAAALVTALLLTRALTVLFGDAARPAGQPAAAVSWTAQR